MICLFFGCWNEPGHNLVGPGRRAVYNDPAAKRAEFYRGQERIHLDGTLAPRFAMPDSRVGTLAARVARRTEEIVWVGQGATNDERSKIRYRTEEAPEGQFLLHHLDNGFTAIQWWDRQQGDRRGACNSTVLLEGVHDSLGMIHAAKVNFPHVGENLAKAGISLVEVFPGPLVGAPPV